MVFDRVLTNSPQYKNANIAKFVFALPLETNYSNKACDPEIYPHVTLDFLFHIYLHHLLQIKKTNAKVCEYKVFNSTNIADFV